MRFIDNGELRQWVQENLQRKLIQQAHELAVQTGCEVLLRLQDADESPQCKYYITDGLKEDYTTHGVRLAPGDQPMSGESGLPAKRVHDFTCQAISEPVVFVQNETPEARSVGTHPEHGYHDVKQNGHHTNGEWRRLCMEHMWWQQVQATASPVEVALQKVAKRQWPVGQTANLLQPGTTVQSEATLPIPSERHGPRERCRDGDALRNLKQLHMRRLIHRDLDEQNVRTRISPREFAMVAEEGYVQAVASLEDNPQLTDEVALVSRQEQAQPAPPPPPPPHPTRQDERTIVGSASSEAQSLGTLNSTQQRYLCRICERTFCDLYNLVSHAKIFHSTIPELIFVCNTCKSQFQDAQSLHNHLGTHGDIAFYTGAACQLKSPSSGHHQRLVQQRRFPCPECGKMFSRFGFMQSHIERVHGGTHISASMDTTALSEDTLISHDESPRDKSATEGDVAGMRLSSEKHHQCLYCHERFDNVDVFQQHVKEFHLGFKIESLSAPPPFTQDAEVPSSRIRSNSEDLACGKVVDVFRCQECGKEFPRGKLLQNHVNSNHIPSNFNQGTQQQESAHWRPECSFPSGAPPEPFVKTGNADASPYHCTTSALIPKREPTQDILDLSSGSVSGEASLTPSDDSSDVPPDQPGSVPNDPVTNMQEAATGAEDQGAASGEDSLCSRKRFACDVCGKTYKYGFHMKEHRLTHAAVCPFVCRLCGMGFFRQRQLRDHELRHSGAYPCRCDICGKGFPRTSELKRHMAFRHRRQEILTRRNSIPAQ